MNSIRKFYWVGLVLAVAACGGDPPPAPAKDAPAPEPRETLVDLLAELDQAVLRTERSELGLRPKRVKRDLELGWRSTRKGDGCHPCALGVGERSELELFLAEPREVSLRLTCGAEGLPPAGDGEGERTVAVAVNGSSVGVLGFPREQHSAALPIDARKLRRGVNRVVLEHGGPVVEPPPRPGKRAEEVARIVCSEIGWEGSARAKGPRELENGRLRLPAGSGVDFHVELPPGARLEIENVTRDGATLHGSIETADGRQRKLALPRAELTERGLVRISLVASGTGGKVDLRAARITVPEQPAQPTADSPSAVAPRKPPIVLFLVDTLRRDRLGAYGNPRGLSPQFDRFAGEAVLFERATAQAPWTVPTVASIFTGLEPTQHGANESGAVLVPEVETLAELLGAAGYRTVGFVASGAVSTRNGFAQGFERYEEFEQRPGFVGPDSPVVIDRLEQWLAEARDERPLFLYVHTVDPHAPYGPPARHRRFAPKGTTRTGITAGELVPENLEVARGLYDGEVAFADESFGRTVELLRKHGLYDEALVIFVADHGEQFLEHRGWRHRTLHGEVLSIPLAIKPPAKLAPGPARIAEPVYQIDLLPTLAALVGQPLDERARGVSLLPQLRGGKGATLAPRGATFGYVNRWSRIFYSVYEAPYKLIWRGYKRHREVRLYDLARDPAEARDLAGELPVVREHLKRVIRMRPAAEEPLYDQPEDAPADELTEKLKAMGYVR